MPKKSASLIKLAPPKSATPPKFPLRKSASPPKLALEKCALSPLNFALMQNLNTCSRKVAQKKFAL